VQLPFTKEQFFDLFATKFKADDIAAGRAVLTTAPVFMGHK